MHTYHTVCLDFSKAIIQGVWDGQGYSKPFYRRLRHSAWDHNTLSMQEARHHPPGDHGGRGREGWRGAGGLGWVGVGGGGVKMGGLPSFIESLPERSLPSQEDHLNGYCLS